MKPLARSGGGASRAVGRAGLTLLELLVAAGLFSILAFGLFGLLRDFLRLWQKSEERRAQTELSSSVAELLARDLATLETGERGDFLAEWVGFDTDGNRTIETFWPRLRFVRPASAPELAREGLSQAAGKAGQVEVLWLALPADPGAKDSARRAAGVVLRGVRLRGDGAAGPSMFDPAFFSAAGTPLPGSTEEVTSGLLWWGLSFAAPTSELSSSDEWKLGTDPRDCRAAWDAWGLARADAARHPWNETPRGIGASSTPRLPRRVRVELELESFEELARRTRLAKEASASATQIEVELPERAGEVGGHVKIGAEWLQVTSSSGRTLGVLRARRGTSAQAHPAGAVLHRGRTAVRELPIGVSREDWDL
jgi:hypothetical protein